MLSYFWKIFLLHGGVNTGKDKAYYSFPSSHFLGLKLLQEMKKSTRLCSPICSSNEVQAM